MTLPRTKNDKNVLPHPIDPCAEDIFGIGILAWRTFSGQAPWSGVLDTDLKELRSIVGDPIKISFYIEKDVRGLRSREFLYRCITVDPQTRDSAESLLNWFIRPEIKEELIKEWSTAGRIRKEKRW